MRREILLAYVTVLERADELLRVCATATGGVDQLRLSVEEAFRLSPVAARPYWPCRSTLHTKRTQQIRQELGDVDRQVARKSEPRRIPVCELLK